MLSHNLNRFITGLVVIYVSSITIVFAQTAGNEKEKAPVSFGKISVVDFKRSAYPIDSLATAVIIADIGSSRIEGNNKGWFSVIHTHYRRVHILNKTAYDLADVIINLYKDSGDQEKLVKVKANTYNLEGDKIITNALANRDIFTDKGDKNHLTKKFTLPNVKEGAIIEYEYTTSSDFLFNFQPWSFQGTVPRLWSEYTVEIPQFLDYVMLSYGYNPFYIKSESNREKSFRVSDSDVSTATERYTFTGSTKTTRFVMKNVNALKEEPFTSTLANHISRIEFQLSGYKEPLSYKRILGDWPTTCEKLLSYDDFGADLASDNSWLADEVKQAKAVDTSLLNNAKAVYYYIRDQYKCNGTNGVFLSKTGLKNVVKARGGKIADVNLLLTAMLKYLKIEASPVILSTTEHGKAHAFYPLMSQYNYVVVSAIIDGQPYLLDASRPSLPFGKLMPYCYNGVARSIDKSGNAMLLLADSLKESSQISINLQANEKGEIHGDFRKFPGDYESIKLRTMLKNDGLEGLKKDVEQHLGTAMALDSIALMDAETIDKKPTLTYHYTLNNSDDQLLLICPLQAEVTKQNPFTSTTRSYPIEMPYGFDELLQFSLTVPKGYTVDEMPKSVTISLDEQRSCIYQYRIQNHDDKVEVLSRFIFNRATFEPEEYNILRSFFDLVVKKQQETIVLKKI